MDPSDLAKLPGRLVSHGFVWDVEMAKTSCESWAVLMLIALPARVNVPLMYLSVVPKSAVRGAGCIRPMRIF